MMTHKLFDELRNIITSTYKNRYYFGMTEFFFSDNGNYSVNKFSKVETLNYYDENNNWRGFARANGVITEAHA